MSKELNFAKKLEGVYSAFAGRSINPSGVQVWKEVMKTNKISLDEAMQYIDQYINDVHQNGRLPTPHDIVIRAKAKKKIDKSLEINYSPTIEEGEKFNGVPKDLISDLAKSNSKIVKRTRIFGDIINEAISQKVIQR